MLTAGVNGEGWWGLCKCDHFHVYICLCSGLAVSSVTTSTTTTRVTATPPSHSPSQHSGRCTSVNPGVLAKQNLRLIRSLLTPPSLRAVTLPQDPTQTLTTPTTQPSDTGTPNLPSAQWTDTRDRPSPPSHCHGPHGAFLTRGMMTHAFCSCQCKYELVGSFSGLPKSGSWLWFVSPLIVSCGPGAVSMTLSCGTFLTQSPKETSSLWRAVVCSVHTGVDLKLNVCNTHRSTLAFTSRICERLSWLADS